MQNWLNGTMPSPLYTNGSQIDYKANDKFGFQLYNLLFDLYVVSGKVCPACPSSQQAMRT